jgi:hypothetical protein
MADWRQIQARIRKAKASTTPADQLAELYQRTRDAMVAFELARWQEKAGDNAEAVKWYTAAAERFRRAQWRVKAEEALTRLGAPIPAPISAEQVASDSAAAAKSDPSAASREGSSSESSLSESKSREVSTDEIYASDSASAIADDARDQGEELKEKMEEDADDQIGNVEVAEVSAAGSGAAGAAAAAGVKKHRRRGRRGGRNRRREGQPGAPGLPGGRVAGAPAEGSPAGLPGRREPARHIASAPSASLGTSSSASSAPLHRPAPVSAEPVAEMPSRNFESRGGAAAEVESGRQRVGGEQAASGWVGRMRTGEPALASRISQLESQLRRLLACPMASLDDADQAPAGPGVLVLSDSDQVTHYYVEECQTLRIGIGNLLRGARGSKGLGQLKERMAENLGVPEARVSKYLKDNCGVRWLQLDEGAAQLAHFAIAVLRPVVNE